MKRTKFLVVVFLVLLVVAFLFSTTVLLPQGSIARMISPDAKFLQILTMANQADGSTSRITGTKTKMA